MMEYKYITKNNIKDCQNYMYSEFSGWDFLDAYFKSRNNADVIEDPEEQNKVLKKYFGEQHGELFEMLAKVYIQMGEDFNSQQKKINQYLKTFEVRKLIYNQYVENNGKLKPIEECGNEYFHNYIALATILNEAYNRTKNLKYLSCLLKIDDTLLSVKEKIDISSWRVVTIILNNEVGHIKELIDNKRGEGKL